MVEGRRKLGCYGGLTVDGVNHEDDGYETEKKNEEW